MAKQKTRPSVRSRIAEYLYRHPHTTRSMLSQKLGLSMPTILSSVSEMLQEKILLEAGELESTGGRKASALQLNPDWMCALGISITRSSVEMVLCSVCGSVLASQKLEYAFRGTEDDLHWLADQSSFFLGLCPQKPAGTGIALPGIVRPEEGVLARSHVMGLENYSLSGLKTVFSGPLFFENDANAALLAERPSEKERLLFLHLGQTVGGAFLQNGQIVRGDHDRAGEFGHIIVYPGGRTCYCGKRGCADAYCSAEALLESGTQSLSAFMEKAVLPDTPEEERWKALLEALALLCTNLRMAYDADVLIGGPLAPSIQGSLQELKNRAVAFDRFDSSIQYLKIAKVSGSAAAIGAADLVFLETIRNL